MLSLPEPALDMLAYKLAFGVRKKHSTCFRQEGFHTGKEVLTKLKEGLGAAGSGFNPTGMTHQHSRTDPPKELPPPGQTLARLNSRTCGHDCNSRLRNIVLYQKGP